ncbi:MAG: hypothetical protein GY926_21290 [bacterium]|nr:hypothetical protein [bacterium]
MRWGKRARDRSPSGASVPEHVPVAGNPSDIELTEVLARFRREVERSDEPSMGSLFAAAEELARQCLAQRERVVEAVAALEAAQEVERVLAARLESIVDLICNLPSLPATDLTTDPDRRQSDQGWQSDDSAAPRGPERVRLRGGSTSGLPSHHLQVKSCDESGQQCPTAPIEAGSAFRLGAMSADRDHRPRSGTTYESLYNDVEDPLLLSAKTLEESSEVSEPSSSATPAVEHDERSEDTRQPTNGNGTELGTAELGAAVLSPDLPSTGLAALFFGPLRLYLDGTPLEPHLHGKAFKVFSYLVANHDRPIPKDVLIEMFWPQSEIATGRRGLHQAVYTIRKALRPANDVRKIVVFKDDSYQINPAIEGWTDVDDFELHVRSGQRAELEGDLDRAQEMYSRAEQRFRGDFLEDAPYEDWAIADRSRLRLVYVEVANRVADLLEDAGEISRALAVSGRVLRIEPCDEESHRRAMRCYTKTDQRTLAIRQYRRCAEQLEQIYGLTPSPATTELHDSLISG